MTIKHWMFAAALGAAAFGAVAQEINFGQSGLVIRAKANALSLVASATRLVRGIVPNSPVEQVLTVDQIRDQSVAPRRLNATLLSSFSLLALLTFNLAMAYRLPPTPFRPWPSTLPGVFWCPRMQGLNARPKLVGNWFAAKTVSPPMIFLRFYRTAKGPSGWVYSAPVSPVGWGTTNGKAGPAAKV